MSCDCAVRDSSSLPTASYFTSLKYSNDGACTLCAANYFGNGGNTCSACTCDLNGGVCRAGNDGDGSCTCFASVSRGFFSGATCTEVGGSVTSARTKYSLDLTLTLKTFTYVCKCSVLLATMALRAQASAPEAATATDTALVLTERAVGHFLCHCILPSTIELTESATGNGVCTCQTGYSGADCSTCAAGYTAALQGGQSVCVQDFCTAGDPSDGNPCENGGTCSNQASAYQCSCAAGYEGTNCETDINWCSCSKSTCSTGDSSPCMNFGQCSDGLLTFTCT